MWRFAVLLVGACGRIGFDLGDPAGSGDGGVTGDGGGGGGDCWASWLGGNPQLTPPTLIAELDLEQDKVAPSLSSDSLSIAFAQNDGSEYRIYGAQRATRTAPWAGAALIDELDSGSGDFRLSMNDSGTVAVLSRGSNVDLYEVTRASAAAPWNTPSALAYASINSADDENDPELTPDGLHIYYTRIGGGTEQLVRASRSSTAQPFGTPAEVVELAPMAEDSDPTISPDQRVIVFAASDGGSCTISSPCADLYFATRSTTAEPFGAAQRLSNGVNTIGFFEFGAELSHDGCELFFVSDRAIVDLDLYVTTIR